MIMIIEKRVDQGKVTKLASSKSKKEKSYTNYDNELYTYGIITQFN